MANMNVKTPRCKVCGSRSIVSADVVGLAKWADGELIQKALPKLSPDQRELLISGTHSACLENLLD